MVLLEAWQRLLRFRLLRTFGAGLLPCLLPQPNLNFPLSVAIGTGQWALVSGILSPRNRAEGAAAAAGDGTIVQNSSGTEENATNPGGSSL